MNDFTSKVVRRYDSVAEQDYITEFYENSGFLNYGYRTDNITDVKEACENLVEKLLSSIPDKSGKILDVGCGNGVTTRYLTKYYDPEDVTGINISAEQIKICRRNAPGCTFLEMDAANLNFDDNSLENIICVEAAHHFTTRRRFIKEAHRVLKPGGTLASADLLMYDGTSPVQPPENAYTDMASYRDLYTEAGFKDIDIIDSTEQCVGGFYDAVMQFLHQKRASGKVGPFLAQVIATRLRTLRNTQTYVLVAATKSAPVVAKRKKRAPATAKMKKVAPATAKTPMPVSATN